MAWTFRGMDFFRRHRARILAMAGLAVLLGWPSGVGSAEVWLDVPRFSGNQVYVPVVLSGGGPAGVSGVQFDVHFEGGTYRVVDVEVGAAALGSDKDVIYTDGDGHARVIVIGMNQEVVADGVVATVVLEALHPGAEGTIKLERLLMSDPFGNPIEGVLPDGTNEAASGDAVIGGAQQQAEGAFSEDDGTALGSPGQGDLDGENGGGMTFGGMGSGIAEPAGSDGAAWEGRAHPGAWVESHGEGGVSSGVRVMMGQPGRGAGDSGRAAGGGGFDVARAGDLRSVGAGGMLGGGGGRLDSDGTEDGGVEGTRRDERVVAAWEASAGGTVEVESSMARAETLGVWAEAWAAFAGLSVFGALMGMRGMALGHLMALGRLQEQGGARRRGRS